MSAVNVRKPILGRHHFRYTRRHIPERNPLSALSVGKRSLRSRLSVNIRGFTRERSRGSALSVGKPFVGIQDFAYIGKLTSEDQNEVTVRCFHTEADTQEVSDNSRMYKHTLITSKSWKPNNTRNEFAEAFRNKSYKSL